MPLQIRSTKVVEDDQGGGIAELVISDSEVEDKVVETLHICVRIQISEDSYLPRLQVNAIDRANEMTTQASFSSPQERSLLGPVAILKKQTEFLIDSSNRIFIESLSTMMVKGPFVLESPMLGPCQQICSFALAMLCTT